MTFLKKSIMITAVMILAVAGAMVVSHTTKAALAPGTPVSYTSTPWSFFQTGCQTDRWNRWELNAYSGVTFPEGSGVPKLTSIDFKHASPSTGTPGIHVDDSKTVTAAGPADGYKASIEKNGWSGHWSEPDVTTTNEKGEGSSILLGNNPYTLQAFTTCTLEKGMGYTVEFEASIDEGAYMSQLTGDEAVSQKYVQVCGLKLDEDGGILYQYFTRFIVLSTTDKTFKFHFYLGQGDDDIVIKFLYGAFIKPERFITYKEVNWVGTVNVKNLRFVAGDTENPVTTTTRKSYNYDDTDDELVKPAKVTGLKVKNNAKKKAIVSWKGASYARQYQVNYALKSSFKGGKKKKSGKKKITISGLKKKKTYYFRVRGINYDDWDTLYGAWSAKKKVKIKR